MNKPNRKSEAEHDLEETTRFLTMKFGARNVDRALRHVFHVVDPDKQPRPFKRADPEIQNVLDRLVADKPEGRGKVGEHFARAAKIAKEATVRYNFVVDAFPADTLANETFHMTDIFAFDLGEEVGLVRSNECGDIVARAQFAHSEPQYQVRYEAGGGRQVEAWWGESAIREI